MNTIIRQKLEMAARVSEFVRSHTAEEPGYAPVLARLEERLDRADAIKDRQHKGLLGARAARTHRRELRRIIQFQLLRYLTAVGSVATKHQTELVERFKLPRSSANNSSFLTATKALIALAEEQKDLLVSAGMKLELLDDLHRRVAEFEAAIETARTARRDHIGARADLSEIATELLEQVKVLDGITRYRFATDVKMMAEWEAARQVPGLPGGEPKPADQGDVPPAPAGEAPAA